MPLTGSGAISLNEMHVEAGGSSGTECSLNDSDIRGLISKSAGASMAFNEWYNAALSIPDFSQTINYGQMVNVEGSQYAQSQFVNRGFRSSAGQTIEGTSGVNGETSYGSMTNQSSNFFSNATINRIRSKATTLSGGVLLLGVDSVVANNDTAFSSMSVNSTTFNRSAATYATGSGHATWTWAVSAAPSTIGNAWSPWPSTSGNAGTNVGSCNVTFSR